MALGATVYRANVNLSNLNTHQYEDLSLTLAKHPSESEARLMYRLLAFLYSAHEDLKFGKGISSPEEPDLWQKNYTGEVIQWIDLGTPDVKRVRQACGRSEKVVIFTYNQNTSQDWFDKIKGGFIKNEKLSVFHLNVFDNGPIEKLAEKGMNLTCLIDENVIYLSNEDERIGIEVNELK